MKTILQQSTYLLSGLVFALAVTGIQAYTSNPIAPPGGNTPGPISTNASDQYKAGGLSINTSVLPTATLDVAGTLFSTELKITGQFQLMDGTQGLNKVLISDATGLTSWVATSTLGLGSNIYNATSSVTNLALDTYTYSAATGRWPALHSYTNGFLSDPITRAKLCELGGFTSISSFDEAYFSSPGDNVLMRWDPPAAAAKGYSDGWVSDSAAGTYNGVSNRILTTLTCARIGVVGSFPPPFVIQNTGGSGGGGGGGGGGIRTQLN